ncbi:MAG TPA: NAD(+) synthase [Vicinamibacteria bacterium]|nr:NAD(+) synthase [Vicinamibacteria bacterium]
MTTAPFGFLRTAAACPPVRVADPERNADAILAFVERAAAEEVQVLVLPELGITGYTCGDLFFSLQTLVGGAERALVRLLRGTRSRPMVVAVGLPVLQDGKLFNAAAVMQAGELLGVVPKTFLPGYKEYYEERWFSSSRELSAPTLRLAGAEVPFGTDLVFQLGAEPGVALAVEICEDLWAPIPPSCHHAVAGATVILNPSASNDLVAKADYRRQLVMQQSARTLSAYVYANAGVHESTTDLVFGGHLLVAEHGVLLAESERFRREGELVVSDVDVERLRVERARQTSFADAVHDAGRRHRTVPLAPVPAAPQRRLRRPLEPYPFVPSDPATVDARCHEVFSIQTAGLARRVEHTGARRLVLGVSGGLDSTLALLVCARTLDLLGRSRGDTLAVTMPGFGTTGRTLESARRLAAGWGAELREIDIRPACEQHIKDIGLEKGDRESVTFQNLQARERTQVLMDLANKEGGIVVGTGDLSELALGFATFAGDQIAMYNVNASVPKTLVRRLVEWVAEHHARESERAVLRAVLQTPVSPELIPTRGDEECAQRTEDLIGPYELHDFFLYGMVRLGAGPRKLMYLACHAFEGRYSSSALRGWLRVFLERFFAQQFKRSVMPDGPKVGSVSLSPRGDWRMPSDATADAWLRELDEAGER